MLLPHELVAALGAKKINTPRVIFSHDVSALGLGRRVLMVCDARTHAALGARLASEWSAELLMLPGEPAADEVTAARVRAACVGVDWVAAVGSGTINDVCKYAAHGARLPYVCVPTAASMNGYASANASIIVDGHKISKAARLPVAVVMDTEVIAAAPARLRRAGLGDSVARSTAQADWLLSHVLLGTDYDGRIFAWMAEAERAAFAAPEDAMALMRLLLISGLGMTLAGGSAPASQGEHMIVHTYESMFASDALHGEAVGVATLYMARLQERVLAQETIALYEETHPAKRVAVDMARWLEARERIQEVMMPAEELESVLKRAGAATMPEEIGWSRARFEEACVKARFSRDRFGFLDLSSRA